MLNRLSRAIAAIGLIITSACHVTTSPDSDLGVARQRWALKQPTSYDITVRRLCFCPTEMTNPVTVSVREGVVTGRVYAATGTPVSAAYAQYFTNVEGLFLIIDDALTRHAFKLDTAYDPTYGYPTSIDIDYVHNAADDELQVQVSGFTIR